MDHSVEEAEETDEGNEAVRSTIPENEETEMTTIYGDQRVWVKPPDELFTHEIKEELPENECQIVVDVKDEIEEQEQEEEVEIEIEEDEMKVEPTIRCEPIDPLMFEVQCPKIAIPRLPRTCANKKVQKPKGRMGRRPRPILPMTVPIATTSTSHMEQAATPHQIIVPSPQMPGIAYQIFLGDHGKNSNNPVQYTMLQSQPMFLQQTPSAVNNPSSVVLSQSSVVINQSYQMTQAQIPAQTKVTKIAPKIVGQSLCSFCYKLFNNMNEHVKECWANPDSKNYKFRKIAPSTTS